jgi:hypothetical protein
LLPASRLKLTNASFLAGVPHLGGYTSWSVILPLSGNKYRGIVHVCCKVSCTAEIILASSQIFTTHKLLTYLSARHDILIHFRTEISSEIQSVLSNGMWPGFIKLAVSFTVADKVLKNMFEKIKLKYVYFSHAL